MTGAVGILNVGAGDTKLSFDPKNPAEVRRAAGIVKDMLARGFAIFVEVGKDDKGPLYRRATAFDSQTAEYIITGGPNDEVKIDQGKTAKPSKGRKATSAGTTRISASRTSAVAVARTAGG